MRARIRVCCRCKDEFAPTDKNVTTCIICEPQGTTGWIRTCQECGHEQEDKEPAPSKEMTLAYRDRKCKRCKSESLDYGTYLSHYDEDADG